MAIPEFHEVRVRARGVRLDPNSRQTHQVSTRSDFVAPELSPVSTLAAELDKGRPGWTDRDAYVPLSASAAAALIRQKRIQRDIDHNWTVGETVIRQAPAPELRVMNRQGPATRKRSKYAN